jgi:hypothetical protein
VNASLYGDLFWLIGLSVFMLCGTAIIVTLIRMLDD